MLEGGLEFLKYDINIEKASMIYLSPVQKEHVKKYFSCQFTGSVGTHLPVPELNSL